MARSEYQLFRHHREASELQHVLFVVPSILQADALPLSYDWRDAVRGARSGLEYPELLRGMFASELTSQIFVTRER